MKYCTKCGKPLSDEAIFCSGCGTRTEEEIVVTPSAVVEPRVDTPAPGENAPRGVEAAAAPETAAVPETAHGTEATPVAEHEAVAVEKPKKKKKVGKILAIIIPAVLLLAAGVLALFFFLHPKEELKNAPIDAYVNDDGTAYICYGNGEYIKLGTDIDQAYMTPDRSKVVVVKTDGYVYWMDVETTEKYEISYPGAGKCNDVDVGLDLDMDISDTAIFFEYEIEDYEEEYSEYGMMAYHFGEKKETVFYSANTEEEFDFEGYDASYAWGDDLSFLFALKGEISVWSDLTNELEVIATYPKEVSIDLIGVSADGSAAAWKIEEPGSYSIYLYQNGTEQRILSEEIAPPDITVDNWESYFNSYIDETYDASVYETEEAYRTAVLYEWMANLLDKDLELAKPTFVQKLLEYYVDKGAGETPWFSFDADPEGKTAVVYGGNYTLYAHDGEVKKIKFSGEVSGYQSGCTTDGKWLDETENSEDLKGYYVCVYNEEKSEDGYELYSVYLITFKDGEKIKLISNARDVRFVGDKILYYDENDVLRGATVDLEKNEITDSRKISSDVYDFYYVQKDSNRIYYLKNRDRTTYTADLYYYDFEKDYSERVSSEVYTSGIKLAYDGSGVFYFTDKESCETEESYLCTYGTLNYYDVENEERTRVAQDVIVYSVTSHLYDGIDPESLWFEKYRDVAGESYYYDVWYYDGEEAIARISNMLS